MAVAETMTAQQQRKFTPTFTARSMDCEQLAEMPQINLGQGRSVSAPVSYQAALKLSEKTSQLAQQQLSCLTQQHVQDQMRQYKMDRIQVPLEDREKLPKDGCVRFRLPQELSQHLTLLSRYLRQYPDDQIAKQAYKIASSEADKIMDAQIKLYCMNRRK